MQVSDDFLDQWEHIIAGVNKTDVPLECIKKVVIKLAGNRQKTINLHLMLKQGLALEVDDAVVGWLARQGYEPEYGARPLRRLLRSWCWQVC